MGKPCLDTQVWTSPWPRPIDLNCQESQSRNLGQICRTACVILHHVLDDKQYYSAYVCICFFSFWIPSANLINIAMENHHFQCAKSTISMVIFHSYVKLPEGKWPSFGTNPQKLGENPWPRLKHSCELLKDCWQRAISSAMGWKTTCAPWLRWWTWVNEFKQMEYITHMYVYIYIICSNKNIYTYIYI